MATSTSGIPVPLRDITCQQLLAMNDVTHHGVLRQRRMLNEWVEGLLQNAHLKWSRVYAVLYSGCLYLFKNELSPRARFATSLYGFTHIAQCETSEVAVGVSWPFKVVSEIEYRNCIFYFSSPSQADTEKWVQCLAEQMAIANRLPPPQMYSASNVADGKFIHPETAVHSVPLPPIPQQQQQQQPVLAPRSRPQPSNTAVVSPTCAKQRETIVCPPPSTAPQPRPRLPPPVNCPDLQIETAESDDDDNEDEDNYDTVEDLDAKRAALRHKTIIGGLQSMGDQLKRGFTNIVRKNDKIKADNKSNTLSPASTQPSPPAAAAAGTTHGAKEPAQPRSRPPLAAPAGKSDSNEPFRALPPMPKQSGNVKSAAAAPPATAAKPTRAVRPTTAPKPSSPRSPSGGDNVSTSSDTYNRSIASTSSNEQTAGASENEHYDDIKAPRDTDEDIEEIRRAAFWNKSSAEAEEMMRTVTHEGAFMLRESAGDAGKLTLMVRIDNIVRKFKIHTDPESGESYLEPRSQRFKTDSLLLAYYRKNPLPLRTTMLTQPYSAVMSPYDT